MSEEGIIFASRKPVLEDLRTTGVWIDIDVVTARKTDDVYADTGDAPCGDYHRPRSDERRRPEIRKGGRTSEPSIDSCRRRPKEQCERAK